MKCLDTYALVEICEGNPAFVNLLNEEVVITDLTLAEFYGDLCRKYGEPTANYWHKKLAALCRAVSREILLKAVKYRLENKKQNLSFFDCVGYIFAVENNLVFITGDKEFKDKPNVQFMTKSIRISDEAYELLLKMKAERESFSDVLLREIEKYQRRQKIS